MQTATRRAPVSIESILAAQKASKEESSKPKFLSKSERAAQALANRAKAVEEQKEKANAALEKRKELEKRTRPPGFESVPTGPRGSRDPRDGGGYGRGSGRGGVGYDRRDGQEKRFEGVPTGPRALRDKQTSNSNPPPPPSSSSAAPPPPPPSNSMPPPPPPSAPPPPKPLDTDAPMLPTSTAAVPINQNLLMNRYLGAKAGGRRKIRKMSDKKFVFDWDRSEDTGAEEVDPIYRFESGNGPNKRQKLLFGRGRMGGMEGIPEGGNGSAGNMVVPMDVVEEEMAAGPRALELRGKNRGNDERHWSEKTLIQMRDRDWRIFREDYNISARGGNIPLPLRSWRESEIDERILDAIDEIGYKEPSPIQRQAIPIGLQNRDLIGVAETGSGKTAAFVIPMLMYIGKLPPLTEENRHLGPYAIVLAPTRELAQQIETETNKFTSLLGYRCVSIVGGKSIEQQASELAKGVEIIVAAPGRLKDCIERHMVVLSQCTYVVLDEADRMVALGFEEVLNFILDALPVSNIKPDTEDAEDPLKMLRRLEGEGERMPLYRQTVMFSATMPTAVERLAKKYLRRPAVVTIGVAGQAVDTVEQRVEFVQGEEKKKARLLEILNSEGFAPPIIIFVNQKKACDVLAKELSRARWSTTTLHSGKNQQQREDALASLRSGASDILVATDLAGRGIDVSDVSLVVNFHMSGTIEAYVHRIGRTGRAGKQGTAVTFLTNDDAEIMYDLKQELMKSPVSRVPPELAKHEAAQSRMTAAMKRMRDADEG
ncbi:DEAD-domain-containing protein [Atractiella rhizophila]|nr:DEAD-domain-containing protein [Atractiella rhizophila]